MIVPEENAKGIAWNWSEEEAFNAGNSGSSSLSFCKELKVDCRVVM